jgi:hypothetical protein
MLNLMIAMLIPWMPIRVVSDAPIIADVQSHLPAGNPYRDSDPITTVHESTHGINSLIRQHYGQPGFYLLNNKAAVISEPKTGLSKVAQIVPASLRGEVYDLYLIQQRIYWENEPSYVFDEMTAYTNGAEARYELGIAERQETVRYMLEFIVYSACVAKATPEPQMREFLRYQIERAIAIYHRSAVPTSYLNKLQTNTDANELRQFLRDYFGRSWCRKELGI